MTPQHDRPINSLSLVGWVEVEPTIRYFGYKHVRADFRLRTEEVLPTADGGEPRHLRLYHHIIAWGRVAELVELSVREGQEIHLSGRITYDAQGQGEDARPSMAVECLQFDILQDVELRHISANNSPDAPEIDWTSFAPTSDEDPMA